LSSGSSLTFSRQPPPEGDGHREQARAKPEAPPAREPEYNPQEVRDMKKGWTMKDLENRTDLDVLQCLVSERMSELNPYAPLYKRLQSVYNKLDRQVFVDKTEDKATA
jgi:transposase InsO family protein